MTFRQIVDAVLRNRFDETDRASAKEWVNHRYGWLLALEEWTFLNGTATVGVTAGSMTVSSLPTDFGIATALLDGDGRPLTGIPDVTTFYDRYQGADAGIPEAFTVLDGVLLVGPKADVTGTDWTLLYEKDAAPMSGDTEEPIIPELFHLALVHGGRSEGMKLQHDPTWRDVEQDFLASVDAMRRKYLVGVRSQAGQYPAWRP